VASINGEYILFGNLINTAAKFNLIFYNIQGGSNMTGTDLYVKSRTKQQLCDLERVKPQPPPSLLLGLEPVQSCLGFARVMSE